MNSELTFLLPDNTPELEWQDSDWINDLPNSSFNKLINSVDDENFPES